MPTMNRVDLLDCANGHHQMADDIGTELTACRVCGFQPVVALKPETIADIVAEMLAWNAAEFDGPPDVDLHLSGADMIDAFTFWRERLKVATKPHADALALVVDAAGRWAADLESGLEDGTYDDECDLEEVQAAIELLSVEAGA